MGTTIDKLQAVLDSKEDIKAALERKEKNPGDVFSSYAGLIDQIADLRPKVESFEVAANNQPSRILAAATDGVRIVVLRKSGLGAYSDDGGASWTEFDVAPGAYVYKDMICVDGKYYAVAESSSDYYYSEDGITWVAANFVNVANWKAIAYEPTINTFVVVAKDSTKAAYSTDGTTWTATTLPAELSWNAVAWCGDRFIAVAGETTTAAYSYDGITWTSFELPETGEWGKVAYGNGVTVILETNDSGNYTKKILRSTNNTTFTSATLNYYNYRDLAFYNGVWIAVAASSSGGYVYYSYDAITWKRQIVSGATYLAFIVILGEGKFVLISGPANVLDSDAKPGAVTVLTKVPSEAIYLGNATPGDVPVGVTFTSMSGFGLQGQLAWKKKIVDALNKAGIEVTAVDPNNPTLNEIVGSIGTYVAFSIGSQTYIYILGGEVSDEAMALTGGWDNEPTGGDTTHSATLTGTYKTINAIDFTNIKSITFNVTYGGGSSGGGTTKMTAGLYDGSSFVSGYSTAVSRTSNSKVTTAWVYDTSELTGSYYLGFYYWLQAYRYARIDSILIEI